MSNILSNTEEVFSLIRGSKTTREQCIRQILLDEKYNASINKIVRERSGHKEDVVFILHHTLVSFMKQVLEKRDLIIEGNLYGYLNGIAKFIWLGELRKKKKLADRETSFTYETHDIATSSHEITLLNTERNKVLGDVLTLLGEKCKAVLSLWAGGYSMKEIAEQTGYNSESVARKKKFQCMKSLSKYLDTHPEIKEMLR